MRNIKHIYVLICLFLCILSGCEYEMEENKEDIIPPILNSVELHQDNSSRQEKTPEYEEEYIQPIKSANTETNVETEKIDVIFEESGEKQEDLSEHVVVEPVSSAVNNEEVNKQEQKTTSSFEVHYIDVGQGDCSLVICDGEAMLIDAGGNDKGTAIQLYLKKQGINSLKYVVASHPDADHIGGLDVIIYKFDCQNILMSNASNDTKTYEDVLSSIKTKGYKPTIVDEGEKYELGSSVIEILSPPKAHPYADTNNNSIIMRVIYGNTKFLFTGDALVQPQQVIIYDDELDASADVVKIPHHGADSAYMKGFYDEINPKYAIISVGSDNKYGHPHQNILDDLQQRGVRLYRTDEQGTIIAKSNGTDITFNYLPSETWQIGNANEYTSNDSNLGINANTVIDENNLIVNETTAGVTYVYNKNSKRFHIPTCPSASEMKQKNREELTCSRDQVFMLHPEAVPCKRCNP